MNLSSARAVPPGTAEQTDLHGKGSDVIMWGNWPNCSIKILFFFAQWTRHHTVGSAGITSLCITSKAKWQIKIYFARQPKTSFKDVFCCYFLRSYSSMTLFGWFKSWLPWLKVSNSSKTKSRSQNFSIKKDKDKFLKPFIFFSNVLPSRETTNRF